MKHSTISRAALALASLTLAGLAGCSGSGDPCAVTNQDEALACLGVPKDDSPRHDLQGAALPESYAPLGTTAEVGVSSELFLAGMKIAPPTPTGPGTLLPNRAVTVALADDATHVARHEVLDTVPPGTAWETDTTSPTRRGRSRRAPRPPPISMAPATCDRWSRTSTRPTRPTPASCSSNGSATPRRSRC